MNGHWPTKWVLAGISFNIKFGLTQLRYLIPGCNQLSDQSVTLVAPPTVPADTRHQHLRLPRLRQPATGAAGLGRFRTEIPAIPHPRAAQPPLYLLGDPGHLLRAGSLLRNFHAPATAICAAAYGYRVWPLPPRSPPRLAALLRQPASAQLTR